LWLIKVWFSASTFVVKIANFPSPKTLALSLKDDTTDNKRTEKRQSKCQPFAKPKEPFFANAPTNNNNFANVIFE